MITVQKLIQELSKYDPNATVVIFESSGYNRAGYEVSDKPVEEIRLVKTFVGNNNELEYCVRLNT